MESIKVVRSLLKANDEIARENREAFARSGVYVINLLGSPGSGKTTLLERTITALRGRMRIGVIEGDLETSYDAERIAALGVPALQINTGGGCHLDSLMVKQALGQFPLGGLDLLFVENVGNLVCPATHDLGEDRKVLVVSTTEGAEKPKKYPRIFLEAQVLVVNKLDLLPHVECDVERMTGDACSLNPKLETFRLSARSGAGVEEWCRFLERLVRDAGKRK